MKFLCDQCKAKYQIADEKVAGKTVRMKCRKCGHLIEVRAAVTESSAASAAPPVVTRPEGSKPPPPRPPPKPAAPKPGPLATSLTAARPAPPKPDRSTSGGALAGAFRSSVQREEETSAPVDMSELSASEDWYVAVNGVPVGPVRIGEIRRKAALGAVTEDSLAWQEGLDEWRPVRSFPDLAAIVREAATSGRPSLTPPPREVRSSLPPPARPLRPSSPGPVPARPPPARPSFAAIAPSPPAARNNVVPLASRLATAEKLEQPPQDVPAPLAPPPAAEAKAPASVVPDPFAAPAPPVAAMAPPGVAAPIVASPVPAATTERRAVPWTAVAMVGGAIGFGGVFAYSIFFPHPVVVQVPAAPQPPAAPSIAAAPVASTAPAPEIAEPAPSATAPTVKAVAAAPRAPAPTAVPSAPTAPGRSLDLHSLTQGTSVTPTEEPAQDGPKAPGQCLTGGQIQQVIGLHQTALRRVCWERIASAKATANITVTMTVGPDGSAQGVTAAGDDPAVAKCIENDVRGWRFPAMGCSQAAAVPFHFVRQ